MSFSYEREPLKPLSLLGAVQRDRPERLRELLKEENPYLRYGIDDLSRALLQAADRGNEECAYLLLEAKAMPNLHDASGNTPIGVAAARGHDNIIRLLLDKKYNCNVNKRTFRVRATALHWAATHGHAKCVSLLLGAGAQIEMTTMHGKTPLMMASRSDFDDIVQLLLDEGATVNARDIEQASALHFAAEEGCEDVVRLLLKNGAFVDGQMRSGCTPFILAAKRGHVDVMRMLKRAGCDDNKKGHEMNALQWAAEMGQVKAVEYCIRLAMDVDEGTKDSFYGGNLIVNQGVTPLMLACRKGHSEVAEVLLKDGCEVDLMDKEDNTALLYAIKYSHSTCVNLLLRHGSNANGVQTVSLTNQDVSVNLCLEYGSRCPLLLAINNSRKQVVRELLRANCDLSVVGFVKGGEPVTPFELSLSEGHTGIARMLFAAGLEIRIVNMNLLQETLAWLLTEDEDVFNDFEYMLRNPGSLMQCARTAIRKSLGKDILHNIDKLPLPPTLLNFVKLQELDDL